MSEHAPAVVVPRLPHGTAATEAPAAIRGSDGASRHGQTHSSCPRATTRLITEERRFDTVEHEVVPLDRSDSDYEVTSFTFSPPPGGILES